MKTKRNHAFTLLELLVVITIIAILAGLAVPAYNMVQTMANQAKGVNNARQIILAMKMFSKEHNSQYPDSVNNPLTASLAQNANEAFRLMIQEKIVTDESIFGCPAGFNPDGNLGLSPNYGYALLPGENHWAITAGQTDSTVGNMPLVFENPATPSWPPLWNAILSTGLHFLTKRNIIFRSRTTLLCLSPRMKKISTLSLLIHLILRSPRKVFAQYGPMFPRHFIRHFNILNGVSQLERNSTLFFSIRGLSSKFPTKSLNSTFKMALKF